MWSRMSKWGCAEGVEGLVVVRARRRAGGILQEPAGGPRDSAMCGDVRTATVPRRLENIRAAPEPQAETGARQLKLNSSSVARQPTLSVTHEKKFQARPPAGGECALRKHPTASRGIAGLRSILPHWCPAQLANFACGHRPRVHVWLWEPLGHAWPRHAPLGQASSDRPSLDGYHGLAEGGRTVSRQPI